MRTVLFVVQDFTLGGTPVVFLRLIRGLDRQRFRPQLALLNRRGELLSELPADCQVFDLAKGSRRGFLRAVARYAALENRLRPAVVVSGLPNANTLCCLVHAACRRQSALIVTEHAPHMSYIGDGRHRFTPVAARRLYRKAARIVAVSDGLRREIEAFYDCAAGRVTRIYNPVAVDEVRTQAVGPPPIDGPYVLFVGRLAPEKGADELLAAYTLIASHTPAKLVFVGDGPLRQPLEHEAARRGITDRVMFAGPDRNPYRWMAHAAVFVSASAYEGFSLSIAEAMAAGAPVVATDCPHGPRELLLDGRCGTLVPPRRPALLADAITEVLTDPRRARVMTAAAAERVRDFDDAAIVAQYEALFEEVS